MSSVGEQLRAAREARELTVEQVAQATKLKLTQIELLEKIYKLYKRINRKTNPFGKLTVMFYLSKYFPWWIAAKDKLRVFALKYLLSTR